MTARSVRTRPLRGLGIGLFACWFAASCAPSGHDPRGQTHVWAPASGAYAVHFLEPPWEITAETDETLFLRIRSSRMILGETDAGPGKFELSVSTVEGQPGALVLEEARQLRREGFELRGGPRAITNLEGVEGREVVARLDAIVARSRRVAYYPLAGTRSVRLFFEADPSLDHPEVEAMLMQVRIGARE